MAGREGSDFDPNIDIPREVFDRGGSVEDPVCVGCGKKPEEIPEYFKEMTGTDLEPAAYVAQEEGTFNRHNGHFLCTDCYIREGMPSAPGGWVAP